MDSISVKQLEVNEQGRDFVIGDLHGAFSCLERALEGVNFDPTKDRLISVGDVIDRGPENEKCLRLIVEPWFHMVMGNHEHMMADFYADRPYGQWWVQNGGAWGLQHKWVDTDYAKEIRLLAQATEDLPLLLTVPMKDGRKFHVLHAELFAMEPLTDADLVDCERFRQAAFQQTMDGNYITWGRFIYYELYKAQMDEHAVRKWRRGAEVNKKGRFFGPDLSHIYSGHTICQRPSRYKGQTNLDTGAYYCYGEKTPYGMKEAPAWAGLTITEPLTDRFWRATPTSFEEVQPLILG